MKNSATKNTTVSKDTNKKPGANKKGTITKVDNTPATQQTKTKLSHAHTLSNEGTNVSYNEAES